MRARTWLCLLSAGAALLVACDAGEPAGEPEPGTPSPLAPGTPGPAAGSPDGGRTTELDAEIADLQDEVAALEGQVAHLQERLAEVRHRAPQDGPLPAPPNSAEGLEDALRAYFPDEHWRPGVTRWRDSDVALPVELTARDGAAADHGELTLRLVDAVVDAEAFGGPVEPGLGFPWEVTTRVLRTGDDEALAIVQQWGTGDDSVSGTDYRFALERAAGGWYVAAAEERDQCTRNERLPGEADLPERCV